MIWIQQFSCTEVKELGKKDRIGTRYKMTYKQLKWFILLIPTVTVGVWEYVRHEYLLPYISMDLGNWLTPVIVLFVTFTLLTRFFKKMENIQEELRIERAEKAVLEERERIASNLHDGMAQSLFLLSIKVRQLDQLDVSREDRELFEELNQTIHHIHDYVRHGIKTLKLPPHALDEPWLDAIDKRIADFERESGLEVVESIDVDEQLLSTQEKVELISCLSEALINIHKHAHATRVKVHVKVTTKEKYVMIIDNGQGFHEEDLQKKGRYGLQMMDDRCKRMNWSMDMKREHGETIIRFTANE